MNILVIGNGFDLAHGLPTKYTDFLNFTKAFMDCYRKADEIDWAYYDTSHEINKYLKKMFSARYADEYEHISKEKEITQKLIEELKDCIDNNVWIEYFLPIYVDRKKNDKDGWIDFEREISKVIQSLDNDMHGLSTDYSIDDKVMILSNDFLTEKYSKYIFVAMSGDEPSEITFREIRDKLLDDLNKLIRALEIYLTEYVEKIDIKEISPDINEIAIQINSDTHTASLAKVISFNYTNTFEQLYDKSKSIQYDYIHGKADINNTIDTNNMVLGIDEYLGKKKRNKQVEFIAFKKFYQRIHKETGCKYREWVDKIQEEYITYSEAENNCIEMIKHALKEGNKEKAYEHYLGAASSNKEKIKMHNLYIFGHSLDVTDKDILRDLILNDNVHTTIFYHDKDAMGQQIANLVKVIGQKELIKRTGGKDRLIEFKSQQKMIESVEE